MTSPQPRIAVVGSTMIDLVAFAARIPGPGETLVGDRFQMGFGGKGANQAVMARILGADVWMVNCVGDDVYGPMTLENLRDRGVDTTFVHEVPGSSGVALIWVEPDGTNRIIIIPGANHSLTSDQAVEAIGAISPDVVLGQFEIPQAVTTAAFVAARSHGAVTILNPAPAAVIETGLLGESDWVVPNEVEFALMFGHGEPTENALLDVATRLDRRLLVTLGSAGSALVEGSQVYRFAAPRVAAVDTTGAGDAFVGAFAYALGAGLDEHDAIRLASLCAAQSVTRPGTQSSFPSPSEASALLAGLGI
jgi:ribokinase